MMLPQIGFVVPELTELQPTDNAHVQPILLARAAALTIGGALTASITPSILINPKSQSRAADRLLRSLPEISCLLSAELPDRDLTPYSTRLSLMTIR